MKIRSQLQLLLLIFCLPFSLEAQDASAPGQAAAVSIEKGIAPPAVTSGKEVQHIDEVRVKGDVLRGQITQFQDEGILLRTLYGSGDVLIKYEDVESLLTFGTYRFVERNGRTTHGRITNFSTETLSVETMNGGKVAIQRDNISRVIRDNTEAKTIHGRLKNLFPYTNVKFDFNWNVEQGTIDKIMIEFGLNVERRKAPTRFVLDLRAAYEIDKSPDTPDVVSKNEYHGSIVTEYDMTRKWYAFLFPVAERDVPRGINLRTYPATGIGYRFLETKRWRIQVQTGIAYVYEKFIDYPDNEYWAAHIGTELGYTFKNGSSIVSRTYYYPGFKDRSQNWLFRTELEVNTKITEALSFKIRFTDTLNNNPAPEVGDNKFTTSMGLSVTY